MLTLFLYVVYWSHFPEKYVCFIFSFINLIRKTGYLTSQLLIFVDELLTGFDALSTSYLYIDKKMQDHGLFQAICRVNRVDTDDKEYGYIIDYKDLFKSLQNSIQNYTSEVFDNCDEDDVIGLLKDRHTESKERLETSLEAVRAMCEPVHPKDEPTFMKFFCGNTENPKVCLEYILVHELVHLQEQNHNDRFIALIDKLCLSGDSIEMN